MPGISAAISRNCFLAAAGLLILLVAVHQLKIYGFALSDIKQVKKVSQRFRIICAGPASDNNGVILTFCHRYGAESVNRSRICKHVGVTHLVLEGDSQKVKILYRLLGFQGK